MSQVFQSQPWKSTTGGRRYTQGHIAVGSQAQVDSIGSSAALTGTMNANILNQSSTTDATSSTVAGILNNLLLTPSAPTSTTYAGQDGIVEVGSGNSSSMSGAIYGDVGAVYNYGSGAITGMAGVFGYTQNMGSATVTDSIGVRGGAIHLPSVASTVTNHSSFSSLVVNGANSTITNHYGMKLAAPINLGTITNNYGLYLEAHTQGNTLNYNIYSAGSSSINYFAGTLAIDTQSGHTLSSTTQSLIQTLVDEQNGTADAMYISPATNGGGRLYVGKSGRAIYAVNWQYVSNFESLPKSLYSFGGDDGYIMRSGGNGFIFENATSGGDVVLAAQGAAGGFITGVQNTTATGWRRWMQFKSYAADADTNQGTPPASYIYDTSVANSTTPHSKWRENGTDILTLAANGDLTSPGNILSIVPGSGTLNVRLGAATLTNNGTGHDNVAIGASAMNTNTTGNFNTAVGSGALFTNLGGYQNTAIGVYAMYNNAGGYNNMALGYQALTANTSAYNNMAVGSQSMLANQTGHENTAVGTSALAGNVSGHSNVAVGTYSLGQSTSGNNVGIGWGAMYGLTGTGADNVAIGYQAGRYQSDGVTPLNPVGNSIYIGSGVLGKDNSDSNSIVIGKGSVGKGANTTVLGNSSTTDAYIFGTQHFNGGIIKNYVAKTTTYAIATTDHTIDCTSGTFIVTLPTAVGVTGQVYVIKNTGTGVITIATTSSQTIDGSVGTTLTTQYSSITVQSNGANWILI